MSISIDFANNLIEKYQMSVAAAIINAKIPFLDGEDYLRPQRSGGIEEGGDQEQYFVERT